MFVGLGIGIALQTAPSRFASVAPFPQLPWIKVDLRWCGGSFADEACRQNNLQGRVLWIDGTANLDRINSEKKIVDLVGKIVEVGFNTVVLDVKPIVGRTLYPSRYTPQMTSWKGQSMPAGFDPVAVFRRETKRDGISMLVSMNAFSEGHSYAKRDAGKPDSLFGAPGWGYEHREHQSVLYRAQPIVKRRIPYAAVFPLCPQANPARWSEDGALFTQLPIPSLTGSKYLTIDTKNVVRSVAKIPPRSIAQGDAVVVLGSTDGLQPGQLSGVAFDASTIQDPVFLGQQPNLKVGEVLEFGSQPTYEYADTHQDQIPLMMNPQDPQVQQRVLGFVREVMSKYKPDGILFDDRFRFHGLDADFGVSTREAFEKRVGRKVIWPNDVYEVTMNRLTPVGIKPGRYFDDWLAWRADSLAQFADKVRSVVKEADPNALFGIYAGSWYGDYAKYGSNYASDALQAGFPFLTRSYRNAGFSKNLDLLITGCYYQTGTMFEAMGNGKAIGQTVEAAGDVSNRVARDGCWVYAGVQLIDFANDPSRAEPVLQAAAASTQGVMVFDLSHNIDKFWPIFERAFGKKMSPPHSQKGLLGKIRSKRAAYDKKGFPQRPFPILEGAPGAGF